MFQRKYATGTGADIHIPIIKVGVVDYALSADWTPVAGDVKISKDGGAAANIGTLPTALTMGNTAIWKFVFSNAELTAARIVVTVADATTKAVEDQTIIIETYGNASAQHAMDFDDAVRGGMTALPNAAADAAGGLVISDAGGLDIDGTNTNVSAILVDTAEIGAAGAGLTAVLSTAMTEAYGTDGSTFSAAQGLYQIWSLLAELNVSGAAVTCKKLDGTTTSFGLTTNSATDPSSITRSS